MISTAMACNRLQRDLVVLNCGGGRQSSALVLMACHGLVPRPDVVVMADTGWERKATLRYWEQVLCPAMDEAGIAYTIVQRVHTHETQRGQVGNIRHDTLASVKDGTRIAQAPLFLKTQSKKGGMAKRACTSEYKIDPIRKYIRREHLGLRDGQVAKGKFHVEQWIGIATEESQRATGSEHGRDAWVTLRYPLLELGLSTDDCVEIIEALGYPAPVKSACIGCPFRSDASWARMKRDDPEAWADACDFDRRLRDPHGLGRLNDGLTERDYLELPRERQGKIKGLNGAAYLHSSRTPLAEVELPDPDDVADAGESFGGEC